MSFYAYTQRGRWEIAMEVVRPMTTSFLIDLSFRLFLPLAVAHKRLKT